MEVSRSESESLAAFTALMMASRDEPLRSRASLNFRVVIATDNAG